MKNQNSEKKKTGFGTYPGVQFSYWKMEIHWPAGYHDSEIIEHNIIFLILPVSVPEIDLGSLPNLL